MTGPRVAIVAGAAGDTGCAVATRLARAGMDVALLDRDVATCGSTVDLVAELSRRSLAVGTDVTDATSVQAALARACRLLGEPTVLVNNIEASVSGPLPESGRHDWDSTIARRLRAAFVLSRALIDPMAKNGGGRIITVADVGDTCDGSSRESLTVRTGLVGFTRTAAMELEPLGITVNLVAASHLLPDVTPLSQRPAYATRVAEAVSLLVSREARFLSGQVICVGCAGGAEE